MSRFADEAANEEEKRCSFGEYLEQLELEERADIEALIETRGYQYTVRLIGRLDGRRFNKGTVSAHDKGTCRCPGS